MTMRALAVLLALVALTACADKTKTKGPRSPASGDDDTEQPEPQEPDADALMQQAEEALALKDYDTAEKRADEVVKVDDKGYPTAYAILSEVAAALGAHAEAPTRTTAWRWSRRTATTPARPSRR